MDSLSGYADEKLADYFSRLPGVAEVEISGGEELELQVILDQAQLAASGLNAADIIAKLKHSNRKIPGGRIQDGSKEYSISYDAEFKNLEDCRNLEVGRHQGRRIYLRDIARVKIISPEKRSLAFINGRPAVGIKIVKKGEANTVKVVNRVKNIFRELQQSKQLPGGMKLEWFYDSGGFVEASVIDAWISIGIAILLTAGIIFIFLHEIRPTLIIVTTMPISIIVTLAVMHAFDFTLNNPTLLALGTSVGVLVTNSLIVLENIISKMQHGESPMNAAETGSSEVAVPVTASAMTNVVVFLPIALMPSIVGRYFTPFAITMTAATLVSLFVSFTLTPILARKFLRSKEPKHHTPMKIYIKHWERFYGGAKRYHDIIIDFCCRQPWTSLGAVALFFLLTVSLVGPKVGNSFFPFCDEGFFTVKLEFPTYYNIEATMRRVLEIEKKLRQAPEVTKTSTFIGEVQNPFGKAATGVYLGEINVRTTKKNERTMDMYSLRELLREELSDLSECIYSVNIPSIVGGVESELEFEIVGENLHVLQDLGRQMEKFLNEEGLAVNVDSSVRPGKPEVKLLPHRGVMQNLGLNADYIGGIIRSNIEGMKAGAYKLGDRSLDIRVKFPDTEGLQQIEQFSVISRDDKPLNLETIARTQAATIPHQITRSEKQKVAKIFADPAPGIGVGELVKIVEAKAAEILPPGYQVRFVGRIEAMREAQMDFLEAFLLALILVYLLIAAILESWLEPLIIMFTVPLGVIGMIYAFYFTGQSLSMMGMLGGVMLMGIVVNDAILIIDELRVLRAQGIPPSEAMPQAVKNKFRPIMMSSIAAVLGIMPMAVGNGLGSELRSSCGIGLVGGLISAVSLTLVVIPAAYLIIAGRFPKLVD